MTGECIFFGIKLLLSVRRCLLDEMMIEAVRTRGETEMAPDRVIPSQANEMSIGTQGGLVLPGKCFGFIR